MTDWEARAAWAIKSFNWYSPHMNVVLSAAIIATAGANLLQAHGQYGLDASAGWLLAILLAFAYGTSELMELAERYIDVGAE